MTESGASSQATQARPVVPADRALSIVFISCCAAFGAGLAHAGVRPWRLAAIGAAVGMGASWGALAPRPRSLAAAKATSPWSAKAQRNAFAALIVVLAVIAAWAWVGTPGPSSWPWLPPLIPPRWLFVAALWVAVVILSFRVPLGGTLPARMGTLGVLLGVLALFISTEGSSKIVSDLSFSAICWTNVTFTPWSSRLLGAMASALFGALGAITMLNVIQKLAGCS